MKPTPITHGMKISRATDFRPGVHVFEAKAASAIRVSGSGFTLDFTGVVIIGSTGERHQAKGIGILLENCKDVTIVGLTVAGFHYGVAMSDCENVTLIDCDASRNGVPKFLSTPKKYNKKDFLDIFHYNVWTKYPAGIYLKDCRSCSILRNVACSQLNGLILDNCERCLVQGNQFGHNLGWGIRLWSSSHNQIIGNQCQHNASAETPHYSYGNDSAGIVIVNACHHNLISGNDLRYSGDGLFMTADFQTEPSNDNIVVGNDGSFSPHNSFESTFCLRNVFCGNIAMHSHYGFWMGYSRDNKLIDNNILGNREAGIAWEHGAGSEIIGNSIGYNRGQGVLLFRRKPEGPPCERFRIEGNKFEWNGVGVELETCSKVLVARNRFVGTGEPWKDDGKGNRFTGNSFPHSP